MSDERTQHQQMRDAINDVELALNGLEIDDVVRLFENADDGVMVKLPLRALRQLARCYPELNRIINDPAFEPAPTGKPEPVAWQNLDKILDVLEAAGCCQNGYVNAPEDVVANALRDWLRSLYAAPASNPQEKMTPLQKRMNSGGPFGGEDVAVKPIPTDNTP